MSPYERPLSPDLMGAAGGPEPMREVDAPAPSVPESLRRLMRPVTVDAAGPPHGPSPSYRRFADARETKVGSQPCDAPCGRVVRPAPPPSALLSAQPRLVWMANRYGTELVHMREERIVLLHQATQPSLDTRCVPLLWLIC